MNSSYMYVVHYTRMLFSADVEAAREFARTAFVVPSHMFLRPLLMGSLNESRTKEERERIEQEMDARLEAAIMKEPQQFNMKILVHFVLVKKV